MGGAKFFSASKAEGPTLDGGEINAVRAGNRLGVWAVEVGAIGAALGVARQARLAALRLAAVRTNGGRRHELGWHGGAAC